MQSRFTQTAGEFRTYRSHLKRVVGSSMVQIVTHAGHKERQNLYISETHTQTELNTLTDSSVRAVCVCVCSYSR